MGEGTNLRHEQTRAAAPRSPPPSHVDRMSMWTKLQLAGGEGSARRGGLAPPKSAFGRPQNGGRSIRMPVRSSGRGACGSKATVATPRLPRSWTNLETTVSQPPSASGNMLLTYRIRRTRGGAALHPLPMSTRTTVHFNGGVEVRSPRGRRPSKIGVLRGAKRRERHLNHRCKVSLWDEYAHRGGRTCVVMGRVWLHPTAPREYVQRCEDVGHGDSDRPRTFEGPVSP